MRFSNTAPQHRNTKTAVDKLKGIHGQLELRVTDHAKTTIIGIGFEKGVDIKLDISNKGMPTTTRAHPRLIKH